jgi:hypothetical protein
VTKLARSEARKATTVAGLENLSFGLAGFRHRILDVLVVPLGADRSRHDGIDQNAVLGELVGERDRQILHGGVVNSGGDGAELRRPSGAAGDVDDAPPLTFAHRRHRMADASHRAAQLVVEGAVPVLLGHGEETALRDVGGVVDQDVEAAKLGEGFHKKIFDCGGVVQIGGNAQNPAVRLGLERCHRVGVARGVKACDHHMRAFLEQLCRDRVADAAIAAGDDRDAVSESEVHRCSCAVTFAIPWPSCPAIAVRRTASLRSPGGASSPSDLSMQPDRPPSRAMTTECR